LLNKIEERSPGTKWAFYSQFVEQIQPLLDGKFPEPELRPCTRCGMPTTAEVCSVCRIKERANKLVAEVKP
jgi:recombinational DNA repair protein RecR